MVIVSIHHTKAKHLWYEKKLIESENKREDVQESKEDARGEETFSREQREEGENVGTVFCRDRFCDFC